MTARVQTATSLATPLGSPREEYQEKFPGASPGAVADLPEQQNGNATPLVDAMGQTEFSSDDTPVAESQEILRRSRVFRHLLQLHVRRGHLLPALVLPELRGGDGCTSCGGPVPEGSARCMMCATAIALAWEEVP